jgi:hypothetical protein
MLFTGVRTPLQETETEPVEPGAGQVRLRRTEVEAFPLVAANEALERLRSGAVNGSVALSLTPSG